MLNILKRIWGDYQRGGIRGLYHWLRCHIWNRYHIINISGEDGYKWGWIDRCHAMDLACWKLLKEFVEKEDPGVGTRTHRDYGLPEDDENLKYQLAGDREIRELYLWWTKGRQEEHDKVHQLYTSAGVSHHFVPATDFPGSFKMVHTYTNPDGENIIDEWYKQQKNLEEKDDEMLTRLIRIRGRLWT